MDNPFFDAPILNSPYAHPSRHWELDDTGQLTQVIRPSRRRAGLITPIPKPRKQKGAAKQDALLFDAGLSTQAQQYHSAIINGVRAEVDKWRQIPNPADWRVTPETARLLQHWRHHAFNSIRPFFCQVEAVETAIWLTEVAPQIGKNGERFIEHLADANNNANPELSRTRPQARHRRRQDHRHGHADRLADHQCRAPAGQPEIHPRLRRGARHPRNRGPDVAAREARADGPEKHPRHQRRSPPLLPRKTRCGGRR